MKTSLTKEQHEKLQELGIECVNTNDIAFLIELLPKDEYTTSGFRFLASTTDERCNRLKNVWCAEYDSVVNSVDRCFYSTELIDALFDLVVWCVDNGYIK